MRVTAINAPDAPEPIGGYAQAMLVLRSDAMLFISGQIPMSATGETPSGFGAQADLCFANIDAQLKAADMTRDNLVKLTFFLSDRKYTEDYRAARKAYLGERVIGLTTIITGIFDSNWLLEIEGIAAR